MGFLFVLAIYNAIELNVLIPVTFAEYYGLYFWSLMISSWGIIPYVLGFLSKFFEVTVGRSRWAAVTLLTIGWYAMVMGQSVVLWTRLHLLVEQARFLRWTKWMIIIDAVILHIPTTVLAFGSNGDILLHQFVTAYNIYEKVQVVGFFIQELILSGLYIYETVRILRTSLQEKARMFMYQLFAINVVIIAMDIFLLGVEFANLYVVETSLKGVIYCIKLKLERVVLGKLVQFVTKSPSNIEDDTARQTRNGGDRYSSTLGRPCSKEDEVPDFVDSSRRHPDYTCVSTPTESRRNPRSYLSDAETDLATFGHVESARLPPEPHNPRSDPNSQISGNDGDVAKKSSQISSDIDGDPGV